MGCITQRGSRDGHAPRLAAGQTGTDFADEGVEPVRQRHDFVVDLGLMQCVAQFVRDGLGPGKQQVISQAGVEQMRLLGHGRAPATNCFSGEVVQWPPTDVQLACLVCPETQQHVEQTGLARTGRADDAPCGYPPPRAGRYHPAPRRRPVWIAVMSSHALPASTPEPAEVPGPPLADARADRMQTVGALLTRLDLGQGAGRYAMPQWGCHVCSDRDWG